ncbi:MAG: DUF3581 domain-containing protein [Gammaproteobacteria bacterium]|nr:DUF3581 domain-containing protein [Gammaproteobacteria bacterium]
MNIADYFSIDSIAEGQQVSFTRAQASSFAKGVAGDFNPIHDVDHRRFCVPGDLLFSVFLAQYGIYQKMKFEFSGMVVDTTRLILPLQSSNTSPLQTLVLLDANDKDYMEVTMSGDKTEGSEFISMLSEKYVQFSSRTFPDILVSLMEKEGVMINPARPLVIYKNMEIHLDKLSGAQLELELRQATLEKNGKKGNVRLEFSILADGDEIGHGAKNLILSGLRDYDAAQLEDVITNYAQRKSNYLAS